MERVTPWRGHNLQRTVALAIAFIVLAGTATTVSSARASDAHEIRHVVIIMQENRSFDSYFGTFPRGGRYSNAEWSSNRLRSESTNEYVR